MKKRLSDQSLAKGHRKAEDYVLLLLKFRPRSTIEVQERLLRKGFDKSLVLEVIESLTAKGLLDDREFARWWVKSRMTAHPEGKTLLRKELRLKGIKSEEIEQSFEEASLDEEGEGLLAKEVALKRIKRATDFSKEEPVFKRRLFSYLKRRGFSTETAVRVIHELLDESYEE